MARCPSCKRHFRTLDDEADGQHGCPYCGYGDEPRLALADDEPEDGGDEPLDDDWERLADAVDSGAFGPETEVSL